MFTPDESGAARTGVVVDVIRATSTICQALASGYERVFCAPEVDVARTLRETLGEGVLGGERGAVRIPGLRSRELAARVPRARRVDAGSLDDERDTRRRGGRRALRARLHSVLLNLAAVVDAVRDAGEDAVVVCAGVQGTMNLDDTFVAGRIVELLGWERTDAAEAAARLVGTWGDAEEAFRASKSGRNLLENAPGLEEDISFCARESILDVVPRFVALRDGAAEIVL